ncbi:MAG: hypothetical protein WBM90_08685, partial [Acidimicrobiia bacterium]
MTATLDQARKAYEAHDWQGAVTALQESDLDNAPDELLLLADALYWDGRFDESLNAFEKAFRTLVSNGRTADAGRVASLLAYLAFRRQTYAVGAGWLAQAQQLLDGEPQTIGHAWLMLVLMGKALFAEGDVGTALTLADEAISVAEHVGSRSAQSLAMSMKAVASIQSGEWKAGLDLLDEANAMAFVGDDLRMTSDVYCNTIS